jgi:predicted ester cyclase
VRSKATVAVLAAILGLSLACRDKAALAALEEQNKETVKRWLVANDKGNFAIVDEVIAEDCRVHYDNETFDREWLRAMCEAFPRSFSNSAHIIDDIVAENDTVIVRLTVRVTQAGDFMGLAPTGKTIDYSAYTLYRLEGGKIRDLWMDHNATLELMKKLGISNERS